MAYEYRVDIEMMEKLTDYEMETLKSALLQTLEQSSKVTVRFWDCESSDCGKCYECTHPVCEGCDFPESNCACG